jgi:hypothetical protein
MTNESTKGALSIKSLDTAGREDADVRREHAERIGLARVDGRTRRKVGRTEPLALRTFPEVKKDIHDMAEAEGKDYIEIVEDAIALRKRIMKGER